MNPFQLMSARFLLFFLFSGVVTSVNAQNEPADKAVLAFSVDMQKLLGDQALKAMTGEKILGQLLQLGPREVDFLKGMVKVSGFFAAPRGDLEPESLVATNMLVVLEMNNEKRVEEMKEQISSGFIEAELDGKKVYKADGFGAPPWFARGEGKRMIFATESYLFADPESLPNAELGSLLKKAGSDSVSLAADLDGARAMLDQLSAMANANADFMTKQYISLIDEVKTVQLSADPGSDPLFQLRLSGHNEKETRQIKLKMDAAIGLLKGVSELGMEPIREMEPTLAKLAAELLEGLTVASAEEATTVKLKRPADFSARFGPSLEASLRRAQAAARKSMDMNKMRQVALSKHNFYDAYRKFPFDPEHNLNLSWRVRVLPFIEESALHDQFDLNQKWDSKTNRKLVASMPEVFRLSNGSTISYIRPMTLPASFAEVRDGTSNTIVFVENRKARMTPWTKPEGLTPEAFAKSVANLKDNDGLLVAFYDGRVTRITNQTSRETLMKLCNPGDGNIIEPEEIK